jgi:PERQ amino acid-rich with GYF domain-containing protein
VQRLFQQARQGATDDFTQWCEAALAGKATSVDVPTFVAFLRDVESPYEVHDYVKQYLGESKASSIFAQDFLERRSKWKNQQKQQHEEEDSIWGPAKAIMPGQAAAAAIGASTTGGGGTGIKAAETATTGGKERGGGRKKKKMQRVDGSLLGFSCTADSGRVNVGEIESITTASQGGKA